MDALPATARPRWHACVLILALVLVANAASWLFGAVPGALRHPYGIDFGEGLILNQARRLLAGENIYGPIDRVPYIVSNYPPLFYALNALLERLAPTADPLFLGRLLAVVGNLGIIGALYAIVRRFAKEGPAWLMLLPLAWLLMAPAWRWGLVVRVDTVAIACALWGLYWALAGSKPIAMTFLTAAVWTKHSMLSAAIAGIAHLGGPEAQSTEDLPKILRWAWPYLLSTALLLAPFSWIGIHLVGYTANEFRLPRLWAGLSEYAALALPLWVLFALVRHDAARNDRLTAAQLYLVLATLTLFTFAATGSDSNYYLEPIAALLVAIIIAAGSPRAADAPTAPPQTLPWARELVAIGLIASFALSSRWGAAGEFPLLANPAQAKAGGDAIVARLQGTSDPVLSEDFTYLLKAGKTPEFQPYIFRLLAESGKWDQTPFVESLEAQHFGLLLLRTDLFAPGNAETEGADRMGAGFDRLTPAMETAIRADYEPDPGGPILADGPWFLYRRRGQVVGGDSP